jgi:hypothetical protein
MLIEYLRRALGLPEMEARLYVAIKHTGVQIMAAVDDMRSELESINSSTNDIAADLDELIGRVSGGVSPSDAEAIVAELRAKSEALRGVASKWPQPA